jgi:hypothetical protein
MLKRVKAIFKILVIILMVVFTFTLGLYLRTEWYDFEDPVPFSGPYFFNPYQHWDGSSGLICNFHAHTNCWSGLTNGTGSSREVLQRYDSLGYACAGISDYHKISDNRLHIYEHGWGIGKVHQLVLGASEIVWIDFPLIQNEHQKQFMIDRLMRKNPESLVVLAHPSLRGAYSEEEVKLLSGYTCFEAVNKLRKSMALWDVALSHGHPVFILGSDDCHNYTKISDIGRVGTYVLTRNPDEKALLQALRQGRHFAVEFNTLPQESVPERKTKIVSSFSLKQLTADSIGLVQVRFSDSVPDVLVMADHGDTLHHAKDIDAIDFMIPEQYTYVRIEYTTGEGHRVYLNPIFRTVDGKIPVARGNSVNMLKTIFYRTGLVVIILLVWFRIFRKWYVHHLKKKTAAKLTTA